MAERYYNPDLITKIVSGTTDNTGNFILTDINPSNADLISAVQIRTSTEGNTLCFCLPCQNYSDSAYMVHIIGTDLSTQANKYMALRIAYRLK